MRWFVQVQRECEEAEKKRDGNTKGNQLSTVIKKGEEKWRKSISDEVAGRCLDKQRARHGKWDKYLSIVKRNNVDSISCRQCKIKIEVKIWNTSLFIVCFHSFDALVGRVYALELLHLANNEDAWWPVIWWSLSLSSFAGKVTIGRQTVWELTPSSNLLAWLSGSFISFWLAWHALETHGRRWTS